MSHPESKAAVLCQEISQRRADSLARKISAYPRTQPIASDLSECVRETVLGITQWRERPLPDAHLKARFERGNLVEDAVMRELASLGITVRVERTPFEVKDKQGRVILRGKVDGFIKWEGSEIPFEVKSLDPNIFRQVETVDDFQRWPWARKYPKQLQSYLLANNIDEGFFLLDDCKGAWKLLPVSLDYGQGEAVLRQCEESVAHRDAGTLPEYHKDPAVCRQCWAFGRVCTPPAEYHGLVMADDPEFIQQLDRRGELLEPHREYEALDKTIKARVKDKDGLVVGQWLIQGKEHQRKGYEVKPFRYWETKITKIES